MARSNILGRGSACSPDHQKSPLTGPCLSIIALPEPSKQSWRASRSASKKFPVGARLLACSRASSNSTAVYSSSLPGSSIERLGLLGLQTMAVKKIKLAGRLRSPGKVVVGAVIQSITFAKSNVVYPPIDTRLGIAVSCKVRCVEDHWGRLPLRSCSPLHISLT